jgi:hypothetical protein
VIAAGANGLNRFEEEKFIKLQRLRTEELVVLSHTAIRCLIAKGLLTAEDLIANLARQGVDAETAFRLKAAITAIPSA